MRSWPRSTCEFEYAGVAVFVAMIFDGLDGRVARWTHTESAFGKEYDSLSDMVSFGVAPAIVTYQWGVARIAEYGPLWRRVGLAGVFLLCRRGGAAPRALQFARGHPGQALLRRIAEPVGRGHRRGAGLAGERSSQHRLARTDRGVSWSRRPRAR